MQYVGQADWKPKGWENKVATKYTKVSPFLKSHLNSIKKMTQKYSEANEKKTNGNNSKIIKANNQISKVSESEITESSWTNK